jgi:Ser/Thr protein kinase RdoA (MazF antagonist)
MDSAQADCVADAVASAFGLGAVLGEWEPVLGGRSHRSWRLTTVRGEWIVKRLNRSREPWWLADHRIAAEIEQSAFEHGIAMPRPIHPLAPSAPLLADLLIDGEPASFLVREWRSGSVLAVGDIPTHRTEEIGDWVGITVAALHRLPVALALDRVRLPELHPVRAWHGWLAESPVEIEPGFVHAVGDYLPDIARATEIAADAAAQLGTTLDLVFTHRDVKPDNILCTPTSPLLVDFDGAGLDVAQWEITRAALAFARTPSGWDHDHARRILRAYRAADGYPVSADPAAFAGLLRSRLGGASWMLFRALGHRPVTGPERAAAREHVLELLADLRVSLHRIEEWTTLLA